MWREFDLKFDGHDYRGYSLVLTGCVWFWVGRNDVTSLGLALFPMSSMLVDTPNTQSVSVKAITTRIAKIFREKQVFFLSDIEEDDPLFWQHLFAAMQPQFDYITSMIDT
uniref:PH domain-containing protein n=1 Tax=Angiostrongylus cantonensis TaxID=6313 RepID=A0A0K0D324_ANGCA